MQVDIVNHKLNFLLILLLHGALHHLCLVFPVQVWQAVVQVQVHPHLQVRDWEHLWVVE